MSDVNAPDGAQEGIQGVAVAGAGVTERGAVKFTQHQIDCVRKYCNEYCGPISTRWNGCSFPVECVGYSPCKPEIDKGLAIAAATPLPQESTEPSSPPAEQPSSRLSGVTPPYDY